MKFCHQLLASSRHFTPFCRSESSHAKRDFCIVASPEDTAGADLERALEQIKTGNSATFAEASLSRHAKIARAKANKLYGMCCLFETI